MPARGHAAGRDASSETPLTSLHTGSAHRFFVCAQTDWGGVFVLLCLSSGSLLYRDMCSAAVYTTLDGVYGALGTAQASRLAAPGVEPPASATFRRRAGLHLSRRCLKVCRASGCRRRGGRPSVGGHSQQELEGIGRSPISAMAPEQTCQDRRSDGVYVHRLRLACLLVTTLSLVVLARCPQYPSPVHIDGFGTCSHFGSSAIGACYHTCRLRRLAPRQWNHQGGRWCQTWSPRISSRAA